MFFLLMDFSTEHQQSANSLDQQFSQRSRQGLLKLPGIGPKMVPLQMDDVGPVGPAEGGTEVFFCR